MNRYMTPEHLAQYHEKLIDYIDKRIEFSTKGHTNCPNCGAVITSETCPYCGTSFRGWYGVKK